MVRVQKGHVCSFGTAALLSLVESAYFYYLSLPTNGNGTY